MANEIARFNVGRFACVAVRDGFPPVGIPEDVHEYFPDVPRVEFEQVYQEGLFDGTCMVIDTGECRVLIDTGVGTDYLPEGGRLLQNLQAAGISPDDVDWVVVTHADGDHYRGGTADDGRPLFANARYVMGQLEWARLTSEEALAGMTEEQQASVRARLLSPQTPIERVQGEAGILPGVRFIPAYGHRAGHLAVAVTLEGASLLAIGDAMLYPFQVEHPDWQDVGDFDPPQAVATRRALLEWAVDRQALVYAYHFPFPSLGRVIREGGGFRWQPLAAEDVGAERRV